MQLEGVGPVPFDTPEEELPAMDVDGEEEEEVAEEEEVIITPPPSSRPQRRTSARSSCPSGA